MPTVSPPAKILVTGANGYIAVWIARILLEQGYSVLGTVRSPSKGEYLERLFGELGLGERFGVGVVEDITKEGAFDEVVKEVEGVLHTASPVVFDTKHPDELIVPAVHGTQSVLNSILKNGPKVKRMVLTSSCAAILEPHDMDYIYSEKDWNEFSIAETREKVERAEGIHQYRASKTLAEKAAWEFVREKAGGRWDLVTILPPYVFGPLLQETSAKDVLNFSSNLIYQAITAPKPPSELYTYAGNWVDVRDVALAHVLALQKEEAGGERFIVGAGHYAWQDLYDGLHAQPLPLPDIPLGAPSAHRAAAKLYDNAKVQKILGIKFRSLGESAHDTIVSARERVVPGPVAVGGGPAGMTLEEVEPAD